ncbi:MAG: ComEC/Rec2 family competence protein [Chloroflexi bacterium]|nr:ComEC/Rec2 family competence protein [Chloroflexota bacterium]
MSAPRDGRQRFTLRIDEPALLLDARAPRYPEVGAGSRVTFTGRVRPPGDDTYGRSLAARGLAGTIEIQTLVIGEPEAGPGAWLAGLRGFADLGLRASVPEPAGGLAAGVLLGLRERVPRPVSAEFVATGLSHVVAISGWNIAIVVAALAALLRRAGRRPRLAVTFAVVIAYVALVGASPPVVRAALMAGVVLAAREMGRAAGAASALGWAVTAMLVADPRAVDDPGFRLSAAATAGLIAWSAPLTARLSAIGGRRLPASVAEALGVSLAAQAATLPLVLEGFGRVSLVSPAVNLVVAPIVAPAMAAGAVALCGGMLAVAAALPAVGALAGLPAWVAFGAVIAAASVGAQVPFASVAVGPPISQLLAASAATALVLVGTARGRAFAGGALARLLPRRARGVERPLDAGASRARHGADPADGPVAAQRLRQAGGAPPGGRRTRVAAVALAVVVAGVAIGAARMPDGHPRLDVLDVGQGDAILVSGSHGGRVLVDGGPDPDRLVAALDALVPPWDRRIDVVVVSHPHEDHVGGLPGLFGRYAVGRVVGSGLAGAGPGWAAWEEAREAHGVAATTAAAGDLIRVDDVRLRVLWPDPGSAHGRASDDGRAVNDTSVVLLGDADGARFLLPGDAEDDVDPVLRARGLPRVTVFKVAHHGSRTASSDALLDAIDPPIAVISVGAHNTYGHPSPVTLRRLESHGSRTFRTDRDGRVGVTFEAGRATVHTERGMGAGALRYHRPDDGPRAPRVGGAPPLSRPAPVVHAARARGRRDRRVARPAHRGGRRARERAARRGGRAPPRRGQARRRPGRRRSSPPARRGFGRMAPRPRLRGACTRRRDPRGDDPRRPGGHGRAPRGPRRGADRRVRGQARRTAPGADGGTVRVVAAPLPDGGGRCGGGRAGGPHARGCRGARACRVRPRRHPAGRRPEARVDRPRHLRGASGASMTTPPAGHADAGSSTAPTVPVVLVRGDDALGVERTARRFAASVPATGERRTVRIAGVARPAWLAEERAAAALEAAATGSLFGDGALVIVSDAPALWGVDAAGRALSDAISLVAEGNVLALLALADESDRPPAGTKGLADAVTAIGGQVLEARIPPDLARWIEATAPEMGVLLGRGAAAELARRIEGPRDPARKRATDVDHRALAADATAELAKLGLYRDGAEVTVEDVQGVVAERLPTSLFELIDAIGTRQVRRAIVLLDRASASVPGPVLVTRVHRRLREIAIAAGMVGTGTRPVEIARSLGWAIPSKRDPEQQEKALSTLAWRVDRALAEARRWGPGELEAALDGLLAVDASMKGDPAAGERAQRLALTLWLVERVAPR